MYTMEGRKTKAHYSISYWEMKKSTKRSNKVKELLYSTFRGNKATMYGILREDAAKEKYVAEQQANHPGLNTKPSGLVVSLENPWLAAMPWWYSFRPQHRYGLSGVQKPIYPQRLCNWRSLQQSQILFGETGEGQSSDILTQAAT